MKYEKKSNLIGKTADAINSVKNFNFKERFGSIPKSIMKFKKSPELMSLIDWDDSEIGKVEGDASARGGGYAKEIRYSIYNPDQAYFILDYYTKEGYKILDPFAGRVTRPIISSYMKREYWGFDTSYKTIQLNKEKLSKLNLKANLFHSDGTTLKELEDKVDFFDAVFTCPPYYSLEKYSGEKGDLSYLDEDSFNKQIDILFKNLKRLIKTSNYENLQFYPVIFTVGSIRQGQKGLLDMDLIFQVIARNNGFVLHDKLFTENLTPAAGFTFRRNFVYSYVTKNYETTLVFLKYK